MIVLYILLGLIAALFFIYAFILVFPGIKGKRVKGFERFFTDYAHRGLWGDAIPENSLAAFKRAADNGFGMELDVRLSKDGVVYVFHDNSLKRMTGLNRNFSDLNSDEIDRLRLLGTSERIPRFSDVLKAVDGRVPIMVELKGENFDHSVCVAADELLRNYSGSYCVESFNPVYVGWYKKNRPEIMRGQLVDSKKKFLSILIAALTFNFYNRPDFISYKFDRYNAFALMLATKLWGAVRVVWTLKSEEDLRAVKGEVSARIFEGFIPKERK